MKLIEVKNLKFSYIKDHVVVDDVSFDIEEGKYISIIGHNGSGKSTISRLLMGLLEADSGTITAFGKELNKKTVREIRRRIGIVFQNPDNQFIGSTVRDDLAFGLENRQVKRENMDEIINKFAEKVNMADFLDKEPEMLSGGQKQRVAIAGVLALQPDVVIFDEATSMLDPKGKREISEAIEMMRRENPRLTIISITHDTEEAFRSDEILAFNKGKLVMRGTPQDFIENEKVLLDIGLELPFLVRLTKELENQGAKIEDGSSLEKVVDSLCR